MQIPDYRNIIDIDVLQSVFFDYIDEVEDDIKSFAVDHAKEFKYIYAQIKSGTRKTVFVIDTNLILHSYKEYLEDMGKYMEKLYSGNTDNALTQDVRDAVNKMYDKDSTFFAVASSKQEEKISDAMKSIEIIIEIPEFISKAKEEFSKKFKDATKIEYARLYASSVSCFSDAMYEGIMNTYEIIHGTLDGTVAQNEEITKESVYKLF